MSLPDFVPTPSARTSATTLAPAAAAVALGISRRSLDKLLDSGILPRPIPKALIDVLTQRERLAVSAGELTVLRTASKAPAIEEDRDHIGFHLDYDNAELEATSLRWWRCDPERVLANRLYTVTVATFPVAVYEVTEVLDTTIRDDERDPRYRFAGTLLTRLQSRKAARPEDIIFADVENTAVVTSPARQHPLLPRAQAIMTSRVTVDSGGPIGYLN